MNTFERYRALAVKYAEDAETQQQLIRHQFDKYRDRFGAESALASQQADSDIAMNTAIADRNRFIQMSIVYSNLAQLHREG